MGDPCAIPSWVQRLHACTHLVRQCCVCPIQIAASPEGHARLRVPVMGADIGPSDSTGWGGGGGGGGGPCAVPPVCAAGGGSRAGGRSASFCPSAFPGQATKRVSLASFSSWGAWPPYRSGLCLPAFSGRDLCGVLARWRGLACSQRFLWELAAGAGGRAVLRLLSQAGGGGTIPPASGGWGPRPRGLWAGGGGGGGSHRSLPALPPGGRPQFPTLAPLSSLAHFPPACAFGRGRKAASEGGGDEGRPVDRSPGGFSRLETPSALPEWAMVIGGVMGGAAPILFWCAAVCRPQAWSARRSDALVWARRSAATPGRAGGWGRSGARCAGPAAPPPPRVAMSSGGGGASPRLRGGGVSLLWLSSWGGERGGRVVGGPLRCPPPPRPVGRRPAIRCLRRAPSGVYSCHGGCRAAVGDAAQSGTTPHR